MISELTKIHRRLVALHDNLRRTDEGPLDEWGLYDALTVETERLYDVIQRERQRPKKQYAAAKAKLARRRAERAPSPDGPAPASSDGAVVVRS